MLQIAKWEGIHWMILGGFLTGLGSQISALSTWDDATTPAFVGGVFIQLASVLLAIKTRSPGTPPSPDPTDPVDWR
jgi:hypothetical protein